MRKFVVLVVLAFFPWQLSAQHSHDANQEHAMGAEAQHEEMPGEARSSQLEPREYGQAQFAAISEIVSILEADEKTDWSAVDVNALHAHLLDMDRVMRLSVVQAERGNNELVFEVTGQDETVGSIQRMSKAHMQMMADLRGWESRVEPFENGARIRIQAEPDELDKLEALGFYGLLVQDAHHQTHHLMIARGQAVH